jgi:hypothetical protein
MFNSELVQGIMKDNQKLGKAIDHYIGGGTVKFIDVEYIPTETTLEPTFRMFFARINGKTAYMKMGRHEYRIRKLIGSR